MTLGDLSEMQRLLARHHEVLVEVLNCVKRLEARVLGEEVPKRVYIRDRRLRLLRMLLDFNEDVSVSKLSKGVGANEKTVRGDLSFLARLGLVSYVTAPNRRCNPGRRGNRPRLTQRGRSVALKAFSLDGVSEGSWLGEINNV